MNEIEEKRDEELVDLGKVSEKTRGFFTHGFMYDGGTGYYYPDTDPYWP